VVNAGQEPGPGLAARARARADISINSYESRIERARLVMQILGPRIRSRSRDSIRMQMRRAFEIENRKSTDRDSPSMNRGARKGKLVKDFSGNLAHLEISDRALTIFVRIIERRVFKLNSKRGVTIT